MLKQIEKALKDIAQQHNCTILFACESGSRAWGFASPDSDYDIRFIYVHPLEWYFRLEKQKDTIDAMLPGDLDFSGWELRKALRLFATCNLPLNEWLGSPTIYHNQAQLQEQLFDLAHYFFNPKKAMFHYLSMARNAQQSEDCDDNSKIKALFYHLRATIACQYISIMQSMPPTKFADLLQNNQLIPDSVLTIISDLLEQKSHAIEGQLVHIPKQLKQWLQQTENQLASAAEQAPPAIKTDFELLNSFMLMQVQSH